jgi:GT2 family glycosyltransferase
MVIIKALKILLQQGPRVLFIKTRAKIKKRNQYKRYLTLQKKLEDSEDTKRDKAKVFQYRPKISIVVPVYNTNEKWLRLCIESVINQVYDNWELCIADGGSTKPHIKRILEQYPRQDARIRVKFLSENKGIAGNSNEALAIATGEFVGFLDHDDELETSALYEVVKLVLYEVAKLLNEKQDIDFIYSDEDKISTRGKRLDPHFKPDWSPDTLYSCNYITHFSVIRKSIVDELGGFREGYDGSQDYDLFLRVVERTQRVAHISKVLYHWRMIPQSAAFSSNAKPYAYIAAKKAIKDSLSRRKVEAEVLDGPSAGFYRVKYKILGNPKVSIIIPTRDEVKVLQRCIRSILGKTGYDNYEILIVDNQSRQSATFKYYDETKSNPKIRITKYDDTYNYSKINNYAVSQVDSECIVFLNNDTEVISREWLTAMLEYVQRKEVGIAGALLYYPNNTIQHAGVITGITGVAGHSFRNFSSKDTGYSNRAKIVQNLSAVSGACMMIKKSVCEKVGGFDEDFQVAFGDIDLCLKVREEGYLIVYTPYAELYHWESLSRGYEDTPEKQARLKKEIEYFQKKWKDVLAKEDPYYNPNLTIDREDFSIRV